MGLTYEKNLPYARLEGNSAGIVRIPAAQSFNKSCQSISFDSLLSLSKGHSKHKYIISLSLANTIFKLSPGNIFNLSLNLNGKVILPILSTFREIFVLINLATIFD